MSKFRGGEIQYYYYNYYSIESAFECIEKHMLPVCSFVTEQLRKSVELIPESIVEK